MKISPYEKELNSNLGPSKFSSTGFMGNSNLSIDELITSDKRKMNDLGVDPFELANQLELIYAKAQHAFGAEVEVKPNVFAIFFESRGKIPSPFKGHGVFEKGETILFSKVNNKQIIITKLGIAMIKSYSFFQGPGSRYRIDPNLLVELLNVSTK